LFWLAAKRGPLCNSYELECGIIVSAVVIPPSSEAGDGRLCDL
jgi:hypothetical protein